MTFLQGDPPCTTDPLAYHVQAVDANRLTHDGDEQPQTGQTHTLASVARHCTPSDCWIVIRGKVYDVTWWVPKHPGGALIYINAGKDCTQLFDAYHPLYVRYHRAFVVQIFRVT